MRALLFIAALLVATPALAVTPLCVEARSDVDEAGFRKLIDSELGHQPSHRVVPADCESLLVAELFTVGKVRYLTVRVNQEVPVRFVVRTMGELAERLSDAVRQVLHHDPVYLAEDLPRMSSVLRAGAGLIRHGSNRYRLALVEIAGSAGKNPMFASGAAFEVTRGWEHLLIFARVMGAGAPTSFTADAIALRVLAGADLGALWEASARANTTFYLGGGVGLHYARFEGAHDSAGLTPVDAALFSVVARAGVRFLRFSAADLDLFAEAHLPLYKTRDPDSPLLDAYTPFGMAGLGVGF
jgi:hypothetical protein